MVKSQDKRIDKLSANLPPKERALAILDAIRNEDFNTALSLQASTPRKSYSAPDYAVVHLVDAVEILSLKFDIAFYQLLAGLFAALANDGNDEDSVQEMAMKIRNIFALVTGLDMFAERVGISGERLLSFSSVLDSEFFECLLLKPESMMDETLELAKEYCAMMEKFGSNNPAIHRSRALCQSPAMPNGRSRIHSGKSPGVPTGNRLLYAYCRCRLLVMLKSLSIYRSTLNDGCLKTVEAVDISMLKISGRDPESYNTLNVVGGSPAADRETRTFNGTVMDN